MDRTRRSRLRRALARALVIALVIAGVPAPRLAAAGSTFLSDAASHPPPTTGGYAYGSYAPNKPGFIAKGQSFIDPVFGNTITRLTNEFANQSISDIYAKNAYTNADNSIVVHASPSGRHFLSTSTGAIVRANVPGNDESSFAPDDPDAFYWFNRGDTKLHKYSVSSGTSTVLKTFSQPLYGLGGSVDWIDGSGRYMLLHLGSTWRIWDKATDTLYAGAVPDADGGGPGWAGLSPDGKYIVTTNNPPAHRSFAVNHASKTVSTTGVMFWSLCGDHGDLVSASNGKTYFVTFECDAVAGVYAVDVSIPQSTSNKNKQRADNRMLFKTAWSDSGHFSGVSKGPLRDWAYVSVESGDDTFGSSVSNWRPYKQELVMANVVTGEVRRLAHHRSRSPEANYYHTPRVSASWDGGTVTWTSNFGYSGDGYTDLYAMKIDTGAKPSSGGSGGSGGGGSTPAAVTFSNPASGATVSGTVTVTVSGSGGSGGGYSYTVKAGSATIYSGTNGTFSWNTTATTNGTVTLSVSMSDGAGGTAAATRTVTVSNSGAPLKVGFTSPASGATVSGTVPVGMTGSGVGTLRFTLKAGSATLYSGPLSTFNWNTTTIRNGSVVLTASLSDASGASVSVGRTVTVSNTTSTPPTGGAGTATTENVVWTNAVKLAVSGNTLSKPTGCDGCWDAGAVSQQTITSGDGFVQFNTNGAAELTVGLSSGNGGVSADEIKYGVRLQKGSVVEVRERGVYKADWRYVAGAVYKVAVEAGKVKYYENGTLKYTSAQAPTYPLLVDATIGTVGAAVQNAVIKRGTASTPTTPPTDPATDPPTDPTGPITPPPDGTGQDVVWVNAIKVAVDDNTITKNSGCNGCGDAGATSQQAITDGAGSVQFSVSANATMTVGLSNSSRNTSSLEIKFGLRFYPGIVEVRELGVYKADWRQVAGAVYKIAVDGGKVKYYENGTLKYTSAQTPAYPLIVDSTLSTVGASVRNAIFTK